MSSAKGPEAPEAFPTYLSPTTTFSSPTAGYVGAHASHLRCGSCAADLCTSSQIISKGFTGRHGRAYLVSTTPFAEGTSASASSLTTISLPNTTAQKPVPRQLVTGSHTVSDISCTSCGNVLGWKYQAAEDESQRYKVGKFILETKRISTSTCWESQPESIPASRNADDLEKIEFDSQNEDECEDLFSGMWSPALAARRRRRRKALDKAKGRT